MKNIIKVGNKSIYLGFTLAEVLITLSIIGVVASITIPTLMQNMAKNQTVEKLKKEYSILTQAVKLSEQDNGPNSTWDWGTDDTTIRQSFDTYWAPYLKISKYCSTATNCGYNMSVFYCRSGVSTGCGATITNTAVRTTVMLENGTLLVVNGSTYAGSIYIDINGGKGPNMYGKDVFLFTVDPQKGLVPTGYSANNISTVCSTSASGSYCAAKIMLDGWQIKDDYPW